MNVLQIRTGLTALFLAIVPSFFLAQPVDLKQEALEAFKAENYPRAISLLKQVVAQRPEDAEAYFYLGYFTIRPDDRGVEKRAPGRWLS